MVVEQACARCFLFKKLIRLEMALHIVIWLEVAFELCDVNTFKLSNVPEECTGEYIPAHPE